MTDEEERALVESHRAEYQAMHEVLDFWREWYGLREDRTEEEDGDTIVRGWH